MDRIDICIMEAVMDDAQMPFRTIAERLGISPETVRTRYESMKESGTILQASISVDFQKLGYDGLAVFMITCNDVEAAVEELRRVPSVISVNRTLGEYDLLVVALSRCLKDYLELASMIESVPYVERMEVFLSKLTASFPGSTINHRLEKEMYDRSLE
jgi:DNA-binding Lrp family transcriptional regulator